MTYKRLFQLKYVEGLTTTELIARYPRCTHQVTKVALCDVSEEVLKEIIPEEEDLQALIRLKKRFSALITA